MLGFDLDFDGDFDQFDAVTGFLLSNDGLSGGKESELAAADLDSYELGLMGAHERRETLSAAGLNPDDYEDFDF